MDGARLRRASVLRIGGLENNLEAGIHLRVMKDPSTVATRAL
jgi:hypothetical protein